MERKLSGTGLSEAPTLRELFEILSTIEWPDEQFFNDLEEIQAGQQLYSVREEGEECTPSSSSNEMP